MASMNDATLEPEATTDAFKKKFMARLIVVLAGGMFLDGYILGIIGPVSAVFTKELQISSGWEGAIAAAALFMSGCGQSGANSGTANSAKTGDTNKPVSANKGESL